MTIHRADGTMLQAVLLTRTWDTIRVALAGARDALELVQMGGCWYTEEGQRVRLEEAWGDRVAVPLPHEEDFLCQPQLAAYLIGLLGTDSQVPAPLLWQSAGSSPQTLVS